MFARCVIKCCFHRQWYTVSSSVSFCKLWKNRWSPWTCQYCLITHMSSNTSESHWMHVLLECMDIGWNVVSNKIGPHCLRPYQSVGRHPVTSHYMEGAPYIVDSIYARHCDELPQSWNSINIYYSIILIIKYAVYISNRMCIYKYEWTFYHFITSCRYVNTWFCFRS